MDTGETSNTGAGGTQQDASLEQLEADAKRLCTGIGEQLARVRTAHEAAAAEQQAREAQLGGERAKLEDEKRRMENVHEFQSTKVQLDIGGHSFTASRQTLCKAPGSMLESMFSGRHALVAEDGAYFIDRDGTHFRYILNYLRTGSVTSPSDPAAKAELATEADFYCLTALAAALRAPALDLTALLGMELVTMRTDEQTLRIAFFSGNADHFDLHRGLVSVFADDVVPTLTFTPDPQGFRAVATMRPTGEVGARVAVASLDAFRSNFNRQHANVLNRLAPVLAAEPVFIAGGSVLCALTESDGLRTNSWWGKQSDVDMFVCTTDATEGCRIAQRIFEALAVDGERWLVNRSRGVLNLMRMEPTDSPAVRETVQVVLRHYRSPAEVLLGFDFDACCCGYDGTAVWALPRCLRALRTGTNVLNPLHAWPNRPTYEMRLGKYATRGYSVAVPALEEQRIDHGLIRRSQLSELHGMARLMKVAFEMEAAPIPRRGARGKNLPSDNATRLQSLQRVKAPEECGPLKEACMDEMSEVQQLASLRMRGGRTRPESRWDRQTGCYEAPVMFLPSVYSGVVELDFVYMEGTVPEASAETRAAIWAEIMDTGREIEGLPRRLQDSWDDGKRSREYLNSDNDEVTLNAQYYIHAYVH